MSTVTGVSISAGVAYATQLAQTSALNRSLYSLGKAVQNGDLTAAGSILSALIQANPQFASSTADGTTSQDPINQDFQALSDAVANNQVDAAKSAWTRIQSDLAANGVPAISNGAAASAKLLAQSKASVDQEILSACFGNSSSVSVASLLGASSGATTAPDLSSILSNWLTYKANGNASPPALADTTGENVNATA